MALRTPLSVTPHLYMGDSTGRPLDMGTVYFGEQDKDPEFYPIELFSDDALTKPLAQPVHTKGGYLYDKGDMVEPHAKEIIYSVKVLDSYGRKVFYKGAMMRNSWNDDVIEQINTAIIGSADAARQVAIDITNDAINNTAVEGGVLADTFVTVTSNALGSVSRNQRDKNSERMTINDFGGDFVAAGNWVKQSVANYCYLEAGKTYTVGTTGEVYFNRMECKTGRATVIIPENVTLNYIEKLDGSEVLHLKNINFIILGKRLGVAGGTGLSVFKFPAGSVISSHIENIDAYALTNIADKNSWSDDLGMTRCRGFIRVNITGDALLKNVKHYGFGLFYNVTSANINATHVEDNVIGYNNETNVWVAGDGFTVGSSTKITIVNTPAQHLYWINKDNQAYPNGKDVVLCEANHTVSYEISTIRAYGAIERSLYVGSDNVRAKDTYDENTRSGAQIKKHGEINPELMTGVFILEGVYENAALNTYGFSTHGYKDAVIKNVDLRGDSISDTSAALNIDDVNNYSVYGGEVINRSTLMWAKGHGNRVSISDIKLLDVYSSSPSLVGQVFTFGVGWASGSSTNKEIKNLHLENIVSSLSTTSSDNLSPYGFMINGVIRADIINCHTHSKTLPFRANGCDNLHIKDCSFDVRGAVDNYAFWSPLFSKTQATNSYFSANTFDFSVSYISKVGAKPITVIMHFQKLVDTGKVACIDYWKSYVAAVPITVGANTVVRILNAVNSSYEVTATFGNSVLVYTYDVTTETSTVVKNIGDKLTNIAAGEVGKISVYTTSAADKAVYVRASDASGVWAGAAGDVNISVKRF